VPGIPERLFIWGKSRCDRQSFGDPFWSGGGQKIFIFGGAMSGKQTGKERLGRRVTVAVGGAWTAILLVGCLPTPAEPGDGSGSNSTGQAVVIAAPTFTLDQIANDPRVEAFVEQYIRESRSSSVRQYQIKDKYLTPAPAACRYEVEVATTGGETYFLTVDLRPDGSLSIPLGKFTESGSTRSRALDTSRVVAGPEERPAVLSDGQAGRGGASIVTRERPASPIPSGGASAPGFNPRQATPKPSANSRAEVKPSDPNVVKLEAFLNGWLSTEQQDELETLIVISNEPTTFGADRYYTYVNTVAERSFQVTVDVYRDGRIRVFKSQKLD
jgi:hypothetical protein